MTQQNEPNWGKVASLGLEVAAGVGLGLVVGNWMDHRWNWKPWGMLVGAMVGMAAGMYLLIRDVMRMNKD
jgi:F0F1-type ATP synthase assembly protein I